ncbi:hypothetical protein, partial [Bacteroides fragilis]|uniref:hypothetical protein n=1 Tax=Bacteroides fragilis TaxID=817 RepID=UPI0034A3EAEC
MEGASTKLMFATEYQQFNSLIAPFGSICRMATFRKKLQEISKMLNTFIAKFGGEWPQTPTVSY